MTTSWKFKLKFAFRNATFKKGRFVVIVFTLIMMVMLSVMMFALKNYLIDIFTLEYREQYQDVDLVLTYDNYSTSRIVNVRTIKQKYAEYFDFYATFFNLHSLVKVGEQTQYTQIMSSSLGEFEQVIKCDVDALNPGELFITASLAAKLKLNENASLFLEINNQDWPYIVKKIIPDQGLFQKDAIFVNKEELFEKTVWFSPPNLGNIIYLNVKPQYSLTMVKEELLADEKYQNCLIYEAVDHEQVLIRAEFNFSIMITMIVVVFLAMAMIIKSLFPLLFRDFSQQLGVIKLLGGSNRLALQIWVSQFVIYLSICIPLGLGLANLFLNIGARAYHIYSYIGIKPLPILFSLLLFLGFMAGQIFYQYHRLTKQNELTLTRDRKAERQSSSWLYLVCFGGLLVVNLLINPFPKVQALLTLLLVIGFTFMFISSSLRLLSRLWQKKKTFFTLYSVKHLSQNRITHNSLKVIFISLVVLAVSLTMISMFKTTKRLAFDEIKMDYLMTNIYDYGNNLKNDINANYDIDELSEGAVYHEITMNFGNNESRIIKYVLSMDSLDINQFFNYQFLDDSLNDLQLTNRLAIVLPYQYEKIGRIKKGDVVILSLGRTIPEEQFEVVGFYKGYSEILAFTNLHLSDKYQEAPLVNTLFINSDDSHLQKDLIKRYSNRMYFILDAQDLFLQEVERLVAVANFLTFIVWVLVGCFVLVIMNNSLLVFYSLKADYAKIKILGCKDGELFVNILKEIIIIMALALVASFVNVLIVFALFPSLMIMVGYYFQYQYHISDVLWYLLIGILVFSLSYVNYFFKVRNMNLVTETINL